MNVILDKKIVLRSNSNIRFMRYAQKVLMYGAVLCGINCQHIYNLLSQGRNTIYY